MGMNNFPLDCKGIFDYSFFHMNTTNTSNDVQEADVVTETQTPPVDTSGTVLIELESMIKSHISGIDSRKSELRKYREMLTSALASDETYQEHERLAKEAAKVKNGTRQQLMKLPANAQVLEKVHDLSIEIKEMDGALSDYLKEYERMSGSNEIETDDGMVRQIVYVAKLVKSSARK
jgi:hypothetical protein